MGGIPHTVFITGCSSGIGRAAAIRFAERGYQVVATARSAQELADLETQARKSKWNLRVTACDVSDEHSVRTAVDVAHQAFGPIHVLVNNAGFGLMGLLELASLEKARRQLEVNTLGPMRLIQLIAPDMRAAGWGRIINVSSITARVVIPFSGWYAASKHALEALNDALRLELHPFGIRVVSILPGPVKTDFIKNIQLATQDAKPELYDRAEQVYIEFRKRPRAFEMCAEDVAKVIVKVVEARSPRPRYFLTAPAKISAFGKRFVTDRFMDRLMRAVYGVNKLSRSVKVS